MYFLFLFFNLVLLKVEASSYELERLNFFPASSHYINFEYEYLINNVETTSTPRVKDIKEYGHRTEVEYAYKIFPQAFLGTSIDYLSAKESGIRYGEEYAGRFSRQGLSLPQLFSLIRLHEQNENGGIVDLYLNYRPQFGEREIGGNAGRELGREVVSLGLSHGLWENEWEFRTSLLGTFYGEGEEQNDLTKKDYKIDDYYSIRFKFEAQYNFYSNHYVWGGVGFMYSGFEELKSEDGEEIQFQRGSRSIFEFGLKKVLRDNLLFKVSYNLFRKDFFINKPITNLEGEEIQQTFRTHLVYVFN